LTSPGAEAQLRRFWKTVGIQPLPLKNPTSYLITLDGRPLKTPSGKKLEVPAERKVLALLIANEWENQKEIMKVSGLPMVSRRTLAWPASTILFETDIESKSVFVCCAA
jgi:ATP synthase F1 complex assembly factor 2